MRILLMLAVSLVIGTLHAQEVFPVITGNVSISITKGTILADLVLSNLPKISNYVIRLNSGMNIHYFKDVRRGTTPLYYDMDTKDSIGSDETKAYYLHENRGNPARYIPEVLEVKYLGMYPVVADSASGFMGQDWRGNVAFNGYSVRAEGLQGDWYPELYDMDKKRRYDEVKYDIHISCEDCTVLFVNGSSPVKAKEAGFRNDLPCEMSLYCGNFATAEHRGLWLLNSDMQKADEQKLFDAATACQHFYEKMFNIPFKGNLTFVQTTPVADPNHWGFSFYSAPTTFNVAVGQYGLQSLFNGPNASRSKKGMAHELAHYYFGTLLRQQGVLGPVIEEGFAEYLSFELIRSLQGENMYQDLVRDKIQNLLYFKDYQPFSMVRTEADYGNREYYCYYYAPLLYMAIKKEIGDQAMLRWLTTMVNSKSDTTDYSFLVTTLRSSVANQDLSDKVISTYFTSPDALKNAIDELRR